MKKLASMAFAALFTASFGLSSAMAVEEGTFGILSTGYSPLTDSTGTSSGIGIEAGAGYNFNQYFGVEAIAGGLGFSAGSKYTVLSLSLNAVGHIPLHNGVGLYVKAGEGENLVTEGSTNGGTSQNLSGSGGIYGAGLEFSVDKQSVRFGYDHYDLTAGGVSLSTNYLNVTGTFGF